MDRVRMWSAVLWSSTIVATSGGPEHAGAQGLPSTPPGTELRKLTDLPGAEGGPRVSPDGRTLVFHAPVDGVPQIHVMALSGSVPRAITFGPGSARRPTWSPDGTEIAFVHTDTGGQSLQVVAAAGGDPRTLLRGGSSTMTGPDWSPDGARIAFALRDPEGRGNVSYGRSTVTTLDVADGRLREWTTGGDEWWPRWSSDGEWLYYYKGKTDDLEAVRPATGEIRTVGRGRLVGWVPAPSPDGRFVAFISDMASHGLFTTSRWGNVPPRRLLASGRPGAPTYFPDGSALVLEMDTSSTGIVEHDLVRGVSRTVTERGREPRALPDGGVAYLPDGPRGSVIAIARGGRIDTVHVPLEHVYDYEPSPDGHWAVVAPTPTDARHDIHVLAADGTYARQVTRFGDVFEPRWCDGRTLAFTSSSDKTSNTIRRIWLVDAARGEPRELVTGLPGNQWPTDCDGPGGRIAFEYRTNATGRFVLDPERPRTSVEPLGEGNGTRFSPDGARTVWVERRDGRPDVFVLEADGTEHRVTDDDAVESNPVWSVDGTAVLYEVRRPDPAIWLLTLPRDAR